ncbi:MAG: arsenic efflux protein [Clostridiales bacterium]|nr:arsenic efflux protein [Clostridiales bacterium]
MTEILLDALMDSLKMLPFLLAVYLIIEFVEHKAVDKIRAAFASERLGVISAAALGLFPQCGFSVAAANLYSEHLITVGALIAVFISTSDEAIPIVASSPSTAKWLLPLLGIKLLYAIIAGMAANLIFKITKLDHNSIKLEHHSTHVHEGGEHHHCANCDSNDGIFKNAVKRTASIFLFILITGILLNVLIYFIGEERLSTLLLTNSFAQPLIAAVIGLIPNCAASIVLSKLFVSGAISFGALTAGLCAGAGVGLVVLFRVNRNMKQNISILGILYLSSALIGIILQLIM